VASCGVLGTRHVETALDQCYKNFVTGNLAGPVAIEIEEGYEIVGHSFHDASYDAYCTGSVFANETSSLTREQTFSCVNKLYMMQSLYYMDLDPENPDGFLMHKVTIIYQYLFFTLFF
jgi:hypothetical protein